MNICHQNGMYSESDGKDGEDEMDLILKTVSDPNEINGIDILEVWNSIILTVNILAKKSFPIPQI